MNIIFFGSSNFALASLREIINSRHKVLAVVTQPDSPSGRKLKLTPSPVKVFAASKEIDIYQPEDVSSPASIEYIKKFNADLFAVVSFGQILKKNLLETPKFCAVNLHPSLLPKYRGAAPINRSVISGDKTTGVSIIRMNERLDEGDIILKKELAIKEEDTAITLGEELSEFGAKVLLEAIDLIGYGKAVFEKQDPLKATYAPKLKKEDGLINWSETATVIHNKVRGLMPWPGAYTRFGKKTLKVLRTMPYNAGNTGPGHNGEVLDIIKDKGMVVRTAKDAILISHVQLEGKLPLDTDAFLRGHRIEKGYKFS